MPLSALGLHRLVIVEKPLKLLLILGDDDDKRTQWGNWLYSRTDGLVVVGERTNGPVIWRQTRKMQ